MKLICLNLSHLARLSCISLQRWISCSVHLQARCHRSSRAPPAWMTEAANTGSVCSTVRWSSSSPTAALLSSSWTRVCWVERGNQKSLCWIYVKLSETLLAGGFHANILKRQTGTTVMDCGENDGLKRMSLFKMSFKSGRGWQKGRRWQNESCVTKKEENLSPYMT